MNNESPYLFCLTLYPSLPALASSLISLSLVLSPPPIKTSQLSLPHPISLSFSLSPSHTYKKTIAEAAMTLMYDTGKENRL